MKLFEILNLPQIGHCYRLAHNRALGDWADNIVYVETGPRNAGTESEQYRVSFGPGNYDVDWIDTAMFTGSAEVNEPPGIRYMQNNNNSDK
jgi:hypothetical protein